MASSSFLRHYTLLIDDLDSVIKLVKEIKKREKKNGPLQAHLLDLDRIIKVFVFGEHTEYDLK